MTESRISSARQTLIQSAVQSRPKSAYVLIVLGLIIEAVELGRYWLINHPLHWQPQAIAFTLGFVGFYIFNPKGTLKGATFLVNSAGGFIALIRTGKRAGDVKIIEASPNDTIPPPPTTKKTDD
jgi:hypothetical protein